MNSKRRSAVELLLSYPDSTVSEMLGVRLVTLRNWMQDKDFAALLRKREEEQRASLRRLARQAAINAAAALCQMVSSGGGADAKVLLDIIKTSGAYNVEQEDSSFALAEIIRLANGGEGE